MKKTLLILVLALIGAMASAQTIVTPTDNLMLILKNVQKVGSDVELTALVTNCSEQEIVLNLVGGQYQTGMAGSIAYDNEGDIYELGDVLVGIGRKAYTEQYCGITIPSAVSVKCRMLIKNVTPEATQFSKIKLCLLCAELGIENTGVCFELNNINF